MNIPRAPMPVLRWAPRELNHRSFSLSGLPKKENPDRGPGRSAISPNFFSQKLSSKYSPRKGRIRVEIFGSIWRAKRSLCKPPQPTTKSTENSPADVCTRTMSLRLIDIGYPRRQPKVMSGGRKQFAQPETNLSVVGDASAWNVKSRAAGRMWFSFPKLFPPNPVSSHPVGGSALGEGIQPRSSFRRPPRSLCRKGHERFRGPGKTGPSHDALQSTIAL